MQKSITLLILLIGISATALAQNNDTKAIQQRLDEYFRATEAKDWNKVVDMVYPKLFNLTTKEDMVQLFADMEGNGMEFQMKNFKVNSISEPVNFEGERFALVNYSAGMNIRFTSQSYQDSSMVNMLQDSFEAAYGRDNVKYNKEDNSFDIQADKTMFAIAPTGSDAWAFMENNPGQEGALGELIPEAVKEQLGKEEK
ncbi:MAG: hypothetical protein KDD06_11845 [Phaeodactylibacter sp.]|nr:hypothetical protein [Phaeodactylibacter sp.]MCB9287202.1 hypothetical protein [Lewinellaceae bacterium]